MTQRLRLAVRQHPLICAISAVVIIALLWFGLSWTTSSFVPPAQSAVPETVAGNTVVRSSSSEAIERTIKERGYEPQLADVAAGQVVDANGTALVSLVSISGTSSALDAYTADFEGSVSERRAALPATAGEMTITPIETEISEGDVDGTPATIRTTGLGTGERTDVLVRTSPTQVLVATSTRGDLDLAKQSVSAMMNA